MTYFDLINNKRVAYLILIHFNYKLDITSNIVWGDSPCCTFEKENICINVTNASYECTTCGLKGNMINLVSKHLKVNSDCAIEYITKNFCDHGVIFMRV